MHASLGLFMLLGMASICTAVDAENALTMVDIGDIAVVKGISGQQGENLKLDVWRYGYAADELGRYLSRMSGKSVPVVDPSALSSAKWLLVVGNAEENPLTKQLVDGGTVGLDVPAGGGEGFVLRSAEAGDIHYLILAGENSISTLYAVYDYLERFCDVGYFMDGEYVPTRASIPIGGVDRATRPFFRDRMFTTTNMISYGLKKHCQRWDTLEEIEAFSDWLIKRKFNRTNWHFQPFPDSSGMAAVNVYGYDCHPEENYGANWPMSWDYAPQVRTRWIQDWMKYTRRLGLKFTYNLSDIAEVPRQFRDKHPDLPYVPNIGYGEYFLDPDSSEATEYGTKYIREVIRLYGTDHLYKVAQFMESPGASTPDGALKVKVASAQTLCKVLESVDPDYTWITDSWDFTANPLGMWTPERLSAFFESVPRSHMYVFDMAANFSPQYKKTDYFHGADWAFGVMHGNQGDDQLFGNLKLLHQMILSAADDPHSAALKGLFIQPEAFGHNVLIHQLVMEMAWDPHDVNMDAFIRKFCLTRYGEKSCDRMMACTNKVIEAVLSEFGAMNNMYYQTLGITWWPAISPPFDDFTDYKSIAPKLPQQIALMNEALKIALAEEKNQRGNPLFENDLVVYAKTTLGLKSNLYIIRAYEAFKAADRESFDENARQALLCLDGIERILSTRNDYSLAKMVRQIMSVPGTNPLLPKMICQHTITDNYAPVDNFEQMVFHYHPRLNSYFGLMHEKMDMEIHTFKRGEMQILLDRADNNWRKNFGIFPENRVFQGTTVEAVNSLSDQYALSKTAMSEESSAMDSSEASSGGLTVEGFNVPSEDK